jgi:hypothetical protein
MGDAEKIAFPDVTFVSMAPAGPYIQLSWAGLPQRNENRPASVHDVGRHRMG